MTNDNYGGVYEEQKTTDQDPIENHMEGQEIIIGTRIDMDGQLNHYDFKGLK